MIHVLLLILKWIGILLLALLLFLLLLIALVLLVPVRYKAKVVYNETTPLKVDGTVSWLLFVLRVKAKYTEKKTDIVARVFGFPVFRHPKPEMKPKPEEQSETKKSKKEKGKKEKQSKPKKEKKIEEEEKTEEVEMKEEPAVPKEKSEIEISKSEEPSREENLQEKNDIEKSKEIHEKEIRENTSETKEDRSGFFQRILDKIRKVWETVNKVIRSIKNLKQKAFDIKEYLFSPESKQTIVFVWEKAKRLLKHILPGKLKGSIEFGMDDPSTTGQILGAISVFYARYGEKLSITPDFEQQSFACDVMMKGRIRAITVIILVVKVIFSKDVKKFKTDFTDILKREAEEA